MRFAAASNNVPQPIGKCDCPGSWTGAGLPLGVQLVGRLGADGLLLQLAAQLEEARPWFHRYAALDPALTPSPGRVSPT